MTINNNKQEGWGGRFDELFVETMDIPEPMATPIKIILDQMKLFIASEIAQAQEEVIRELKELLNLLEVKPTPEILNAIDLYAKAKGINI